MSRRAKGLAVLAPGFGGGPRSPLLRKLAQSLEAARIRTACIQWDQGWPRPDYAAEIERVIGVRNQLRGRSRLPLALVGRSFGGRISAFVAKEEPPRALVVLGYPIRPPNKRRPRDEQALLELRCPTLVVQGARDELGPLAVLSRLARKNRQLEVEVLPEVGHSFGRQAQTAVLLTTAWLLQQFEGG